MPTSAAWRQLDYVFASARPNIGHTRAHVKESGVIVIAGGPWEAPMAKKDKGGRSSKTAASRSPKEKRQAKKDKKAAKTDTRHPL